MTFWLRAAFRSRDKFKTFYHYLQKKYWHQTRQGGNIQEKLPTLKWHDLLTSWKNHYFYGLLMVFSITKKNTKFNLMSWNAKYVSAKLLRKAWSTKKKKKKSVKFAIEFSKHKNKFMKNFSRESFFSTVNEIIYFLWFNYEYISVEAFKWNSCTFWLNTLDLPVFRIVNYNTNWIKRYNKSIG